MKIAVICSGGDSPGMNSALLAIKTIDSEPDSEVVFLRMVMPEYLRNVLPQFL